MAPVFYEWNVFDLFTRKLEAVIKSDDWIRGQLGSGSLFDTSDGIDVRYDLASADSLPLPDDSVDYVFMDPPFGSNIFYSDMSLFQEAWLGETTEMAAEAVVDRVDTGAGRTTDRYARLLTDALIECRRVVKPGGYITMMFGNSSGAIWQLVQRAIAQAKLEVVPEHITVLSKGQRSVKGLASGFENVATLDLILTMRATRKRLVEPLIPDEATVTSVIDRLLSQSEATPSHLYLELLREGFRAGWDLSTLDLRLVSDLLRSRDKVVDPRTAAIV